MIRIATPAHARRGAPLLLLGVQLLLFFVALSRYDATAWEFRGTDVVDFFNAFWRVRVAGASFFDLFILGLAALLIARAFVTGRWRRSPFDRLVAGLALLLIVSTAVKLLYQGPLDTAKDWLFSVRNYVYFIIIYLGVSRLDWTEQRFQSFMKLVVGLALMTILLGLWESAIFASRISKYGSASIQRDVDDFLFTFFVLYWLIALYLEKVRLPLWQSALAGVYVLYNLFVALAGGSKGTLVLYPFLLLYYAWYYRLYVHRWFQVVAALFALALIPAVGYVAAQAGSLDPGSRLYVFTTFNAEDFSVATRMAEAANFGLNLYNRNAILFGIGTGSKWQEYVPQIREDAAAYPEEERDSGWHFGIHLPILRLALDFGLVGVAALLFLFYRCFRQSLRALRSGAFTPMTNAFVQAAWITIGYQLVMNSLGDPKTNLLAGFLLGANSGLLSAARAGRTIRLSSSLKLASPADR